MFFVGRKAVVEDSSGHEVAADRTLWHNLLHAAQRLRERLTSDPKSSLGLKAGCCDADPAFKHTVEVCFFSFFSLIPSSGCICRVGMIWECMMLCSSQHVRGVHEYARPLSTANMGMVCCCCCDYVRCTCFCSSARDTRPIFCCVSAFELS